VTGVRVGVQPAHVVNDPGSKRVEMKVPNELQEIRLLINHDGFISVLKEMTTATVSPVEGTCVPRKEGSHRPGQWAVSRTEQEMEVIRQESPCVDGYRTSLRNLGQPPDEVIAVPIIPEEILAIETTRHDVMQDSGCIQPWSPRHMTPPLTRDSRRITQSQ
jgi:hypothetical protein